MVEIISLQIPDDQQNIDIRVAVLGGADAGKSTLLGVITQGELDNGKGTARLNMFRHLHEVQSGRTSSISHEILGFGSKVMVTCLARCIRINYSLSRLNLNAKLRIFQFREIDLYILMQGEVINYKDAVSAVEICANSSKLVTFMDLAGHRKYLRTTVAGLSGYSPHHAMLVISSVLGIVGMTREHLALTIALEVPCFVVVTKIDVRSPESILQELQSMIQAVGYHKVRSLLQCYETR